MPVIIFPNQKYYEILLHIFENQPDVQLNGRQLLLHLTCGDRHVCSMQPLVNSAIHSWATKLIKTSSWVWQDGSVGKGSCLTA